MVQAIRKLSVNAEIEGHKIQCQVYGTAADCVKGIRVEIAKQLSGMARFVFKGMPNQKLYSMLTDHWNNDHPKQQVVCPQTDDQFLDLICNLDMAKETK
jgi:hypothetical protein